jgi:hypothetical protein
MASPITSAATFGYRTEALDVLERANVPVHQGNIIAVPTHVDLDADQELKSAIDYLCDEWSYIWAWR